MVSHIPFRTTWGYSGKWKLSTKLLWPKLEVWQQFVHHCVLLKQFDVGAWFSGVFRKNVLLWDMWTTTYGSKNVKNNLMKIIFKKHILKTHFNSFKVIVRFKLKRYAIWKFIFQYFQIFWTYSLSSFSNFSYYFRNFFLIIIQSIK